MCSITHGAILPRWNALSATRWLAVLTSTRWPTALEEAIAATSATAAATKNNEQKIRRHDDGVSVPCEFVIIELPFVVAGIGDPGFVV